MTLKLDRLNPTNAHGIAFQRLWQRNCEAVEGAYTDISNQLTMIQEALDRANANMPDLVPVTITADYTGTVDPAAQLPKNIPFLRYDATTDVSASSAWTATATGAITGSIDAATGVYTMTAIEGDGSITATSVYNSITLSRTVPVYLSIAAAPIDNATSGGGASGSGGTTATTTSFSSINSTTATAITSTLTAKAGSNGKVRLSAPLTVYTDDSTGPAGTYEVKGQWYQNIAGTWTAVGTEKASNPDVILTDAGGGFYTETDGTLSVSYSVLGLTSGTAYDFRFYARNTSGTRTMYFSGTASAVGS